jgi:PHP family Zn ribbon phosphoesterase
MAIFSSTNKFAVGYGLLKYSYDLHIHSALSSCAENSMTPNNIINMAKLQGLRIIAVCDHNSAANLPAIQKLAEKERILLVPGIEFESSEGIHLLCYFQTVKKAVEFSDMILTNMLARHNASRYRGAQLVMNEEDSVISSVGVYLGGPCGLSIQRAAEHVRNSGGLAVPSHVDRDYSGIIGVLSGIPDEYGFKTVEYYGSDEKFRKSLEAKYRVLKNSDAHWLERIGAGGDSLELPSLSVDAVLDELRNPKLQ